MSSPHSLQKNVAPLKIVECYERFKEAIKYGNLPHAYQSLQEMRGYQGGEKLAKELQEDLEALQKTEQQEAEKEHISFLKDTALTEEERAQSILSHLDLFETFFHDHFYVEALEHIHAIEHLGDATLAQKLQKKLSQKVPNLENFLAEEQEKQNQALLESQKNRVLQDFYTAVKQGRTTLAKNILSQGVFSETEFKDLEQVLEKRKEEIQESRRKEKFDRLFQDLRQLLDQKDFQGGKRLLTKMQYTANAEELNMAKEIYEAAIEEDKRSVRENLREAIVKNLKEQDLIMAEKNLKDFKKIASREEYEQLKDSIQEYEIKKKKKQHLQSRKEIERKEKIMMLFEEAKGKLLQKQYVEVQILARKILSLGEEELCQYLKKQVESIQKKEVAEKKELQRKEWIEEFYSFLSGKIEISKKQLFLGTEKLFSVEEIQEFSLRFDRHVAHKDFSIALEEHDFELARKMVRDMSCERHEKARLLLEIREKEQEEERKEREEAIRRLLNQVDMLRQKHDFDALEAKFQELESLGEREVVQKIRNEMLGEKNQQKLQKLQEKIEALKKQGLFEEALSLAKNLLELEQSASYEQVRQSLLLEKERFEKHKQEALFAYISQEIDQWNFAPFHIKKSQLREEQVHQLRKKIQQKKEEGKKQKESEYIDRLKEAFAIAKDQSLSSLLSVYERMKGQISFEELKPFTKLVEQKKEEDMEKKRQEVLESAQYFLSQGNTQALRASAEELLEIGLASEANALIAEALKQEQEQECVFRKQKLEEAFLLFAENIKTTSYMEGYRLIVAIKELLTDPRLEESAERFIPLMEEMISWCVEKEHFEEAKEGLALFELVHPSRSHPLRVILRERERQYLEQYNLVGAEDYVRKQSVLSHYRSWKEAFENGVADRFHTEQIARLGEESFARVLESILETRAQKVEDHMSSILAQKDIISLRDDISTNFQKWSFEELLPVAQHYAELWHHEQRQHIQDVTSQYNEKMQESLLASDFEEARNLLFSVSIKEIDPLTFRAWAEQILRGEQAGRMARQEAALKNFQEAIATNTIGKALSLLADIPVQNLLSSLEHMLLKNHDPIQHVVISVYSLEEAKDLLQTEDLIAAWKYFSRYIESHPEQVQSEQESALKWFIQSSEEMLFKKKVALHQLLEQNDFFRLQEAMSLLEQEEKIKLQMTKSISKNLQTFYSSLQALSELLEEQKILKARNLVQASFELFSEQQKAYLESLIRQAEIRGEYQKLKENFDRLSEAVLSENELLLRECRDQFQDPRWLQDVVDYYLQEIHTKKEAGNLQKQFQQFLQEGRFLEAEKSIKLYRDDLLFFTESSLAFEETKKEFFHAEMKACLQQCMGISSDTEKMKEMISSLESFTLEALIWYGEIQPVYQLQSLFLSLLQGDLFGQRTLKQALQEHNVETLELEISEISYERLHSYYQKLLEEEKSFLQSEKRKEFFIQVDRLLQAHRFSDLRNILQSFFETMTIAEVERSFIPLLEKESQAANEERSQLLQNIRSDLETHIRAKRLKEAQALWKQTEIVFLQGELDDLWLELKNLEGEKAEEEKQKVILLEQRKKESIKIYEGFVEAALKSYNFQEAAKFIQEIESLGDQEKVNELLARYEREKALYEKELQKEESLRTIQHLLDECLWDEAESRIAVLDTDQRDVQERFQKELIRLKQKGKHRIIEEKIQELVARGAFDEAELLLKKL